MVHELLTGAGRARARPGEAGFTLAELAIVIVVASLAAFLFAGTFIEAVRSYEFLDTEKGMLQEARYAEERIGRELLRVGGGSSITRATARSFAFVDRDSATVAFSWTGDKGDPLVYVRNGTAHTLATGVDSLAFAYWRSDGTPAAPVVAPAATDIWRVSVHLRLAKGAQSVSAVTAAFLRPS